jgi:5-methylcytosine-specific restriction endonuclease McrA
MPKAPRVCPHDGCSTLIRHTTHCDQHQRQGWNNPANRTASSRLTSTRAWRAVRLKVLNRDHYRCQIQHPSVCLGHADTVDHIVPVSQAPQLALDPNNLRAACRPCNEHSGRTDAARNRRRTTSKRTPEPHPGLAR